ncbi:Peptidase propeptide and YPEB domain (plasmid) [Rubrobacter radiotolerans]|uniref:PepSY domain-containing protein n=1 Tax=Rubrobacter radiotolerans TaxID=42256 RepID=A0A023X6V8_RUBRA|nr:PepSY domain-containing protein [Rubrobacter radiotolerans]AHY48177.1 Peptidase propeptide and YPEB domain [Rubrobacter radiotolerans]MDX5895436.1 PepSY domain-containing protein [Rubrobacter radiotolerans]SMC01816.1 Peptidase propeptide and YPEB domain-containing protein [Rubrobacter radiotolerans DSM 5868]
MDVKKLIAGALAATALTVGGGAAVAAGQAPETTADQIEKEEQEPSYKGSVQAPADKENEKSEAAEGRETPESEAAEKEQEAREAQQLKSLAKIDQKTAEQAALQANPGTVKDAELGNENGYVVWEVEVAGNDGTIHEVKVDAGNGQILHQETGEDEGSERGEASEADEGAEVNEPADTAAK